MNLNSSPSSVPDVSLTPGNISKAILAAPLLQQSDIAKNFEGRYVSWKGIINSANKNADNKIIVGLLCENISVTCEVNPQSLYILNSVKAGDKVIVTGTISRANNYHVHLTNGAINIAY